MTGPVNDRVSPRSLALCRRAEILLEKLSEIDSTDGGVLFEAAEEKGWADAIRFFALKGTLTPAGLADAEECLSRTEEWFTGQVSDEEEADPPALPPVPAEPVVEVPPRTEPPAPKPPPPALDGITPAKAHELLGLYPPYDPPARPPPRPGSVTFWDPGTAITSLRLRFPGLFCPGDWADKQPFGKHAVAEGWRQLRLVDPGKGYDKQASGLAKDEEPAPARVVVAYLVLTHIATGGWPEFPRVRCRDALASGRRAVVGCFPGFGIELTNAADDRANLGLAAVAVPPVPKPQSRRCR
jgi:hypothetical protein